MKSLEKTKISIISLGCARNLVDSEVMAGKLVSAGFSLKCEAVDSDAVIINTCAFIEEARRESIEAVLKAAGLKKDGVIKKVIVTGCLAQRYPKELKKDIPEIDAILGVDNFRNITRAVNSIFKDKEFISVNPPEAIYSHKDPRLILTPPHYAYVKIAEGCLNRCSYCAIYNIRGRLKSRPASSILSEIKLLSSSKGLSELNIIAQDTTSYGIDRYGKKALGKLLKDICKLKPAPWIRLLYTHPRHFTDELIDIIAKEPLICKYIDLPIQHINDRILSRMNRRITRKSIEKLIRKIRGRIPGVALRTSVIAGFPGEDEKDFKELLGFIKDTRFERLGCFIYSREEGTPAYDFKKQVSRKVKTRRFDMLMQLQQEISEEVNRAFLGKQLKALVEAGQENNLYAGRTQYDAPEVDGLVYLRSEKTLKTGSFVDAEITDTLEYDLVGVVHKNGERR